MTAMDALMPAHAKISYMAALRKSLNTVKSRRRIFAEIESERLRQKKLLNTGQILFTLDSPVVDNDRKLRICAEELGEIAGALDKLEGSPRARSRKDDLRKELIQLAACLVAWLETPEAK